MKILNLNQIKSVLNSIDLLSYIEAGFIAYSQKKAVIPPVGELLFDDPPGDVHIKYGYLSHENYYVIKIASGFYDNPKLGLSSSNGLMLLFDKNTGGLLCLLLDEGYLTNIRTAAAGAVVAKHLAPNKVHRIGIFGAGIQGKLQIQFLESIVNCRDIIVWGINQDELTEYLEYMESKGYSVETTQDANSVASSCNLIITATPTKHPILMSDQIQSGTHITAVGSDTPDKQELDAKILEIADVVIADSIDQCLGRGEIFHALNEKAVKKENLIELGDVLAGKKAGRISDDQITVADLTGVAVQDIQISRAIYEVIKDDSKYEFGNRKI
ncbi:MAG: ornithine cyclodeaminase family protein [FCB group bacterium]|nr:ornithine cyclodeaminase family protein [FCB group bacterium]